MFMRMEFMTCKVREWFQWMRWHVSGRMNQHDCWNIETLFDSTTNFISFSIYELLWNCRMEPVVRGTRYRWTPLAIFSRPSKSVSDNIWSIEWNQFSLWCSDALRWKIFSPIWWCGENIFGADGVEVEFRSCPINLVLLLRLTSWIYRKQYVNMDKRSPQCVLIGILEGGWRVWREMKGSSRVKKKARVHLEK